MKKSLKIILIVVAVLILAALVAIFVISSNKDKGVLEIFDKTTGYKTDFKYSKREGYVIEKVSEDNGTFPEVTFINEKLNFKAEIYYYETLDSLFERNKGLRKNNDNYKEYVFNGFNAYSYTSGNALQADILLKSEQENEHALVLYLYMERFNEEVETDINEVFNSKSFQKILNSIQFTKEEVEIKA